MVFRKGYKFVTLRAGIIAGPYFFMRNKKLLLLFILSVAFIPYLITCFYALPFADDFCFGWTASQKISFTQKFLNQYLYWNGRYTSDVLVNLHPITTGSIFLYQLVLCISILCTPLVVFVFIRQWGSNSLYSIIATLFISLFYLCYLPNITEGVYWYIGLVNYHWGSLCFVLQLTVLVTLLRNEARNLWLTAISLLLLIFAIGFNEIGAALIPVYYLGMLIYFKADVVKPGNTRLIRILIIHFAVAVIASIFVIGSPGNFTRENIFANKFNFLHSFGFAILQTARFTAKWLMSIPSIALSLIVLVNADKVNSIALRRVNWGVWFTLLLFTVFMAAFIPYMATGILGQHRTLNYIFPFFIILWVGVLISISTKYRLCEERTPETTGIRVFIIAVVGVVVMSVSGNGGKILTDFYSGTFSKYKTEFMGRQRAVLQQPLAPIPPLKEVPYSFKIVDTKSDTTWWVNTCMKKFYTETDVVLH